MILDRIREGGPGAYLAILIGLLGLLLGGVSIISLLGKSRASFSLGVATLILALAAAGAGIGGTFWGRNRMNDALVHVDSAVDKERISRVGYRESQQSSWVGLFAALLPLMLGAAAAMGGSRLQQPKTRAQFGDQMAASDDGLGGQTVIAFLFTAIAVIACGGAYAIANGEVPKGRYGFDDHDQDSWSLAGALEDVSRERPFACDRLEEALGHFWSPDDRREWPHKLRAEIAPELADWRSAADGCVKKMIVALDEGHGGEGLTREPISQSSLLESPLLQNDALRTQLLAWKPKEAEPEAEPTAFGSGGLGLGSIPKVAVKEATVGPGSLAPDVIRRVIQRNMSALKSCYERELTKSPTLEGKVVVSFTIGKDGNVASVSDASEPAFPEKKVTMCLLMRFKQMQFPKPDGGGVVNVKYPLIFKTAG